MDGLLNKFHPLLQKCTQYIKQRTVENARQLRMTLECAMEEKEEEEEEEKEKEKEEREGRRVGDLRNGTLNYYKRFVFFAVLSDDLGKM